MIDSPNEVKTAESKTIEDRLIGSLNVTLAPRANEPLMKRAPTLHRPGQVSQEPSGGYLARRLSRNYPPYKQRGRPQADPFCVCQAVAG
jgi:hypothetical protein